ncbi:MAG: hypothetical protein FD180_3972 [Planctomycetota bacterium]|nr:MAG: hypothetical protein FD180_3972 [Planctomycetota bacterium]
MKARTMPGAVALLSCLFALAGDPPDPKAEWQKKWDAAVKNAAKEHAGLAKVAWSRKLYAVALEDNEKAVTLDPGNADAQKGLGKMNEGGVWIDDPKATVKKKNEGKESDIDAAMAALGEKRKSAYGKIVKELEATGDFAVKNKLAEEEKKSWKLVIEYDENHEKARKGLGYEKQDGRWVPPEDVEKRKDGAKKVAGADEGKPDENPSEVENRTGFKMTKRRSSHYFVQGTYSEAEIKELVKCAEGARTAFLETFELKADDLDNSVDMIFVKTEEQHKKFVDTCEELENKGAYRDMGGVTLYHPTHMSEAVQGGGNWRYVKDVCAHDAIHHLWSFWAGNVGNAWLDEGLSYWFTDRLLKSADTHCIQFALSGGGAGKSWDNVLDWRALIKEMLDTNANPDIQEVMEGHINSLNAKKGCKAWSLVDYMLQARKKEFFKFIQSMQEGDKQEEALKKAFGVEGYKDFDGKWKEWVWKNY